MLIGTLVWTSLPIQYFYDDCWLNEFYFFKKLMSQKNISSIKTVFESINDTYKRFKSDSMIGRSNNLICLLDWCTSNKLKYISLKFIVHLLFKKKMQQIYIVWKDFGNNNKYQQQKSFSTVINFVCFYDNNEFN